MSEYAEIEGIAFEPRSSRSIPAVLVYDGFDFHLKSGNDFIAQDLVMETIQGNNEFYFTDGRMFQAHYGLTRELLREFKGVAEPTASRVEVFIPKSIVAILAIMMIAFGGVVYALATIGPTLGAMFPQDLEEAIGRSSYETMADFVFVPSNIPQERQDELNLRMQQMIENSNLDRRPELIFHASARLGANALAFPGGPIVLTDDLVQILDDDMVMAVVAHELGHIEERHGIKQIINQFGLSIIILMVFGNDGSIIEELAVFGTNFWGFKNSRDYEHAADAFAVEVMRENAIDKSVYAAALLKLHTELCAKQNMSDQDCINEGSHWFSTHPSLLDRIDHIGH